jgi:hypothetical protein
MFEFLKIIDFSGFSLPCEVLLIMQFKYIPYYTFFIYSKLLKYIIMTKILFIYLIIYNYRLGNYPRSMFHLG